MPVTAADIKFYLSGGAANSDPNASLGGAISATEVTAATLQNLFDAITGAESAVGRVEYRCFYVKNINPVSPLDSAKIWVNTNTPSTTTTVDIALGGEGDNGIAEVIGSEATPPVGETFSAPVDYASGLSMGTLAAGHFYPIWVRWTVSPGTHVVAVDIGILSVRGTNTPPIVRNPLMPFDMPSVAVQRAYPTKVWAHWHLFPVSVDDVTPGATWPGADYYGQGWINPHGEPNEPHLYCGGFIRDRPLPRTHIGAGFAVADMKTDCLNAIDMGVDGFMFNVTDTSLVSGPIPACSLSNMFAAAAAADPGFKIIPNIDVSLVPAGSKATLAASLAALKTNAQWYKLPDNRLVISVFGAEAWAASDYQYLIDNVNGTAGVALVLIYVAWTPATAPATTYGMGVWGSADLAGVGGTASLATTTHGLGRIWVAPCRPQFIPNHSSIYYECGQSIQMRAMISQAIADGAEWIQLATWNDYSECAAFCPSCGTQYGLYDATAYAIQSYRISANPTVTRDVLLYFHRIMATGASYNAALQTGVAFSLVGGTAAENMVECLAFLVSAGTVEIEFPTGTVNTFSGVTGINRFQAAIGGGSGKPVFRLKRSGVTIISVTSGFTIRQSTTGPQDFSYRSGGSTRMEVPLIANPP